MFFVIFGKLSDKHRAQGCRSSSAMSLTLVLLFPLFGVIGNAANPGLAAAAARAPVIVAGSELRLPAFRHRTAHAMRQIAVRPGRRSGVSYHLAVAPALAVTVGGKPLALDAYPWADKVKRGKALQAALGPFRL